MTSLTATDNSLKLFTAQDALDVISSGLPGCIFSPENLDPEFFHLQNGLAGEIFQKFTNYRFPVAFVIPVEHNYGSRTTELIRDHKIHPYIRFFESSEEATE